MAKKKAVKKKAAVVEDLPSEVNSEDVVDQEKKVDEVADLVLKAGSKYQDVKKGWIPMSLSDVAGYEKSGVLCGYNPHNGTGLIKGE